MNLDLTFNPDFSQVEVDDQVINLTRFEVRLPEKRQFFIQNSDLFANFGSSYNSQPFFSRRIGVAEDKDGNTIQNRIITGARLSGKVNPNLRVGFLNMLTESNISMIFVNRQTVGSYDFVAEDERYNRVAGVDYQLASKDNRWTGRTWLHQSFKKNGSSDNKSWGFRLNRNTRNYEITESTGGIGENSIPKLGESTHGILPYRFTPFGSLQMIFD